MGALPCHHFSLFTLSRQRGAMDYVRNSLTCSDVSQQAPMPLFLNRFSTRQDTPSNQQKTSRLPKLRRHKKTSDAPHCLQKPERSI